MKGRDDENTLSTQDMQERLKGDFFPQDADAFMEEDVCAFFDLLLKKTGWKKSDVIRLANLNRTYGYQIMGGQRLGKRDYYLSIALAMSLDLKTVQRMLAITHSSALHPLVKRDAAIIFAINHKYDMEKTYEFLCDLNLPPLDVGLGE